MKIDLPWDVTKRERLVLFAALHLADEATGEVRGEHEGESGMHRLMRAIGHSDQNRIRETLRMLEDRRLTMRRNRRLFVVLSAFSGGCLCEGCQGPIPPTIRGAQRWCVVCRQTLGRGDRTWQQRAIVLWVAGKTPPEIHAALCRPLWRAVDGDNQSSAIVPYLLAQGLLDDTWRQALKRALEGGGEG